jgi:hypothetical protein
MAAKESNTAQTILVFGIAIFIFICYVMKYNGEAEQKEDKQHYQGTREQIRDIYGHE